MSTYEISSRAIAEHFWWKWWRERWSEIERHGDGCRLTFVEPEVLTDDEMRQRSRDFGRAVQL